MLKSYVYKTIVQEPHLRRLILYVRNVVLFRFDLWKETFIEVKIEQGFYGNEKNGKNGGCNQYLSNILVGISYICLNHYISFKCSFR